ncbi:Membrane protein involved in colicin uptake [Balamuthia mandrillaris]
MSSSAATAVAATTNHAAGGGGGSANRRTTRQHHRKQPQQQQFNVPANNKKAAELKSHLQSFAGLMSDVEANRGKHKNFDYDLLKIPPFHYLHILDNNTNVIRVVEGPCRHTRLQHEVVVYGPEPMIVIPPQHYCVINNPVLRDESGNVVLNKHQQVKLRHGEQEVRLEQEPFPLYPGEEMEGEVMPLLVVPQNTALRLCAKRDFLQRVCSSPKDAKKNKEKQHEEEEQFIQRKAGDEWLFKGPGTYVPQVEAEVIEMVEAEVLKPDEALKLRARRDCTDYKGQPRKAGEEWLVREPGAYLPSAEEDVLEVVEGFILTEGKALHLRAKTSFVDNFGIQRKAGEEWLITHKDGEVHIPHVHEEVVQMENIISLSKRNYCVIQNPVDENGVPQLGERKLVVGPTNFFLLPGESLEGQAIQEIKVLNAEQALMVEARENFMEEITNANNKTVGQKRRRAGDRWLVCGPRDYIPPLEVKIIPPVRNSVVSIEALDLHFFYTLPLVLYAFLALFLTYFFLVYLPRLLSSE